MDVLVSDAQRLLQRCNGPLRHDLRVGRLCQMIDDHHELIASQAHYRVYAAGDSLESPRDLLEQLVADAVSE